MAMCVFLALHWKVRILSVDPLASGCKSHPSLTPPHFAGCARVDGTSCPQGRRGRQKRGGMEAEIVISASFS